MMQAADHGYLDDSALVGGLHRSGLRCTVGTTKESTETRLPKWLSRKVRQVCEGGIRRRTRYLETVACEIARPNFRNSP